MRRVDEALKRISTEITHDVVGALRGFDYAAAVRVEARLALARSWESHSIMQRLPELHLAVQHYVFACEYLRGEHGSFDDVSPAFADVVVSLIVLGKASLVLHQECSRLLAQLGRPSLPVPPALPHDAGAGEPVTPA